MINLISFIKAIENKKDYSNHFLKYNNMNKKELKNQKFKD